MLLDASGNPPHIEKPETGFCRHSEFIRECYNIYMRQESDAVGKAEGDIIAIVDCELGRWPLGNKTLKAIFPKITMIQTPSFAPTRFVVKTMKRAGKPNTETDLQTGICRMENKNGKVVYYCEDNQREGYGYESCKFYIGPMRLVRQLVKTLCKFPSTRPPDPGVWRFISMRMGWTYEDAICSLPSFPIAHDAIGLVMEDMANFFDNIDRFTRYNMPGMRRILLYGPPGTGKTSLIKHIGGIYKDKLCFVLCGDFAEAQNHVKLCADHKKPTVVVIEEVDSWMNEEHSRRSRTSQAASFLDGIDTPVNPNGTFIVMTTNFPERLDERFLRRPGRIDRFFEIGGLKGKQALSCARIYAPPDAVIDAAWIEYLDGLTGAEIKETMMMGMAMAVSQQEDFSLDLVKRVREEMRAERASVLSFAKQERLSDNLFGD